MLATGSKIEGEMTRIRATLVRHDGWTQIAVVLAALGGYLVARLLIEPNWVAAFANARKVMELEAVLHLGWEDDLQRAFLSLPDVVLAMNAFYFLGHFLLTGIFFVWLYRRSRLGFRAFRDGFLAATVLSVLIHWQFPTAPPRLLGIGIEDTVRALWNIDIGSPHASAFSNPVAAVPSLHAGWAVGVGIGIIRYARQVWLRVLGVLYPIAVMLTIIVTGNHFIFDALAGAAVLAVGFMVASLPRIRRPWAIMDATPRGGAVR
jgi:PAP2 superfamily protein